MSEPTIFPEISRAYSWLTLEKDAGFLSPDERSETRDVFQARYDRMLREMLKNSSLAAIAPALIACVAELGNNAFDHNLGKWRDSPGVFFISDFHRRFVVIADRGQGILSSLRRIKPDLRDDQAAVQTAFTQVISGRAPERRGNGLKFVRATVEENHWSLFFQSGGGMYGLPSSQSFPYSQQFPSVQGVIAIVFF